MTFGRTNIQVAVAALTESLLSCTGRIAARRG